MKQTVFRLGELFCGPGGLALGATRAQIRNGRFSYRVIHAWANDIDENSCDTYARNISSEQKSSIICGPVEGLDFNGLGQIDGLAFGFPCNDFSVVGEQKGFNGKYGPLYMYGVKALEAFRPKWFIAENVGGLQTANGGQVLKKILFDLASAGGGYELTPHLYKFEEYGVPQRRHRVIIVGIDKSIGFSFRVPTPTTLDRPPTAKEALEDPPIPANASNQELTRQSTKVVARLKHIPPGENAWYSGIPNELCLNVKGARLSQIYRRLHPNKPAYTLTGSGGGGTHCYHWSEPRALTNRERARLQTFPDDFVFEGSKESVRMQIGMAVPPRAAQLIVECILKTFAGMHYSSVDNNVQANHDSIEFSAPVAGGGRL